MTETALLEVRGVWKAFGGVQAVAGVSLQLLQGEVCALIGPNGAGKTTLLNLLTGQLSCDDGTVLFEGKRISGLPPERIWRKRIGRTFQSPAVFSSLTVLQNVQVAILSERGRGHDFFSNAARLERDRALECLRLVDLDDQAEKRSGTLAFGDLKRLELAVTLANRPGLLILDEPTAGLAPQERLDLMALAAGIVREQGITLLFTEHDMDVVFASAHRILVMHQGRLLADGTPQAVRDNPRVQEVYLGGSRDVGRSAPDEVSCSK
ncbi:MAG TPA: ABC transporter ATP-binding protein [Candidatus Acidoferrum sp.]|nr:ABC transporter ATP-binding protein [Candidatus Acidoferrum sp.]